MFFRAIGRVRFVIQNERGETMESTLMNSLATQGPWALLFLSLFWWTLKENKNRENKYIEVISKLSDEIIAEIKTIKDHILK